MKVWVCFMSIRYEDGDVETRLGKVVATREAAERWQKEPPEFKPCKTCRMEGLTKFSEETTVEGIG